MIVDTRPIVERIVVRCNGTDCVLQAAVYSSGTMSTAQALAMIGWASESNDAEHYCPEHQ